MAKVRERAAKVVKVEARIQTMTDAILGTRNAHIYLPRNIEELQYSLPAQMALSALNKGNGYLSHRDFLEGRLNLSATSDVIQFAEKIRWEVSRDLDEKYPHFVAGVTVYYDDGTRDHLFQERATGSPTRRFTQIQFKAKLMELTADVIGESEANTLFDLIDQLEPTMPIGQIARLLKCR